eukprot:1569900-Prymnesium_polylepis.1
MHRLTQTHADSRSHADSRRKPSLAFQKLSLNALQEPQGWRVVMHCNKLAQGSKPLTSPTCSRNSFEVET